MARLKVLLWSAVIGAMLMSALTLGYVKMSGAPMPLFLLIAVPVGTLLTFLLAAGLMGLIFFSNESGHDQAAADEGAKHDPDHWHRD